MDNSRRKFLGTTLTGAALAISLPEIVKAAIAPATSAPKIRIAENDVILFQGDSITDAGRDKKNMAPNNSGALGHGYALMAGANLLPEHAAKQPAISNNGISGNNVNQQIGRRSCREKGWK